MVCKQLFEDGEEGVRVEVQEPRHELLVREETNDIHYVVSPPSSRKIALWELLSFEVECDNPENLVADVSTAMLNFDLFGSLLSKNFLRLVFLHVKAVFL